MKTGSKYLFFNRFDETFDMVLPEGTDISHTYLLFSVKDQSPVLGEGLLLGEALLPLKDIVKEDGDVSLKVRIKPVVPKSVTGNSPLPCKICTRKISFKG